MFLLNSIAHISNSHMSARIGDEQDGYEYGIVTEMNNLARLKGVGLAMNVKDAANLLNQL